MRLISCRTATPAEILAHGRATEGLQLLAPLPRPGKVVAVGRIGRLENRCAFDRAGSAA